MHLDPTADVLDVRWRLDGVLQPLSQLPKDVAPNIIARLKVLAGLLTYEMALPQEGRICDEALSVEVRVSTFPTLYGERAVLRLLSTTNQSLESLAQLGLPPAVLGELDRQLAATSGAILIVGPAGSGKTTTAYACLRHIVAHSKAAAASRRSKIRSRWLSRRSLNRKLTWPSDSTWPRDSAACCDWIRK